MVTDHSAHTGRSNPPPVLTINRDGQSPFVLVCDHASNRIPEEYGDLGLTPQQRLMHIAWDPGALAVALELSRPARRAADPVDRLPAGDRLQPRDRQARPHPRRQRAHRHRRQCRRSATPSAQRRIARLSRAVPRRDRRAARRARKAAGLETILVTVHSFTPTYKGVPRPWPIGLIHAHRPELHRARCAMRSLADEPRSQRRLERALLGANGVTYTLEHHGDGRGLDATMIEIRHDEILEPAGVTSGPTGWPAASNARGGALGSR